MANSTIQLQESLLDLVATRSYHNTERFKQIDCLLGQGADINYMLKHGEHQGLTPLMVASKFHNAKLIKFLVSKGASVDTLAKSPDYKKYTALQINCVHAQFSCYEVLLECGADPNLQILSGNMKGLTPFLIACSKKNGFVVESFIKHGANVNCTYEVKGLKRATPLCFSLKSDNLPAAKILIKHGADVNFTQHDACDLEFSLLELAIHEEKPKFVKLFLKHGANDKRALLYIALLENKLVDIIKLAKNDADLNEQFAFSPDSISINPLSYAVTTNNYPMAKILLELGASVDIYKFIMVDIGEDFLANIAIKNCDAKMIELLHQNGLSLTKQVKLYRERDLYICPLMQVINVENIEVLEYMLSHGVSANTKIEYGDNKGDSVLHYCVVHGSNKSLEVFIDHGVDLNYFNPSVSSTSHGLKPLHATCLLGTVTTVKILLAAGSGLTDINEEVQIGRYQGYNYLLAAASQGSLGNVKVLLEKGADPEYVIKKGLYKGKTVLEVTSKKFFNKEIVAQMNSIVQKRRHQHNQARKEQLRLLDAHINNFEQKFKDYLFGTKKAIDKYQNNIKIKFANNSVAALVFSQLNSIKGITRNKNIVCFNSKNEFLEVDINALHDRIHIQADILLETHRQQFKAKKQAAERRKIEAAKKLAAEREAKLKAQKEQKEKELEQERKSEEERRLHRLEVAKQKALKKQTREQQVKSFKTPQRKERLAQKRKQQAEQRARTIAKHGHAVAGTSSRAQNKKITAVDELEYYKLVKSAAAQEPDYSKFGKKTAGAELVRKVNSPAVAACATSRPYLKNTEFINAANDALSNLSSCLSSQFWPDVVKKSNAIFYIAKICEFFAKDEAVFEFKNYAMLRNQLIHNLNQISDKILNAANRLVSIYRSKNKNLWELSKQDLQDFEDFFTRLFTKSPIIKNIINGKATTIADFEKVLADIRVIQSDRNIEMSGLGYQDTSAGRGFKIQEYVNLEFCISKDYNAANTHAIAKLIELHEVYTKIPAADKAKINSKLDYKVMNGLRKLRNHVAHDMKSMKDKGSVRIGRKYESNLVPVQDLLGFINHFSSLQAVQPSSVKLLQGTKPSF